MKYIKYKISAKNPRILLDELGNELLHFTGQHLSDWKDILKKLNGYSAPEQI